MLIDTVVRKWRYQVVGLIISKYTYKLLVYVDCAFPSSLRNQDFTQLLALRLCETGISTLEGTGFHCASFHCKWPAATWYYLDIESPTRRSPKARFRSITPVTSDPLSTCGLVHNTMLWPWDGRNNSPFPSFDPRPQVILGRYLQGGNTVIIRSLGV